MKNETQFNVIYNEYAKLVYNLSLHYLHNTEDAQEATQDVFVKIYNKIEGFNNKSSLKTWIYRITINHSLDVIKSKTTFLSDTFSVPSYIIDDFLLQLNVLLLDRVSEGMVDGSRLGLGLYPVFFNYFSICF